MTSAPLNRRRSGSGGVRSIQPTGRNARIPRRLAMVGIGGMAHALPAGLARFPFKYAELSLLAQHLRALDDVLLRHRGVQVRVAPVGPRAILKGESVSTSRSTSSNSNSTGNSTTSIIVIILTFMSADFRSRFRWPERVRVRARDQEPTSYCCVSPKHSPAEKDEPQCQQTYRRIAEEGTAWRSAQQNFRNAQQGSLCVLAHRPFPRAASRCFGRPAASRAAPSRR